MILYTAQMRYAGSDRFDITRGSGGTEGHPFAPSRTLLHKYLALRKAGKETEETWQDYSAGYTAEMRTSYRIHRRAWQALSQRPETTLCCYCAGKAITERHCHRFLLAQMLVTAYGAEYRGER